MGVPTLKRVEIITSSKVELISQLDGLDLRNCPIAFDLRNVKNQKLVVSYLEDYLEMRNISLIPYPLCLLVSEKMSHTKFLIIREFSEVPRFFSTKSKSLNVKEGALLKKINMLQQKIANLQLQSSQSVFAHYSSITKEIDRLNRQSHFLKRAQGFDGAGGKLDE